MSRLIVNHYFQYGWWYCSLKKNDKEISLRAYQDPQDKELCALKMLRKYDILCGDSQIAREAREQYKRMNRTPKGRIREIF